jgi:hypothetical protein
VVENILTSCQVTGYVDTSTLEIGVEVNVFGAKIFNLFGNLTDGVVGRINLFLAKGEIRFDLQNGNGMTFQRLSCSLPLHSLIFYLCSTYYLQVTGRIFCKRIRERIMANFICLAYRSLGPSTLGGNV